MARLGIHAAVQPPGQGMLVAGKRAGFAVARAHLHRLRPGGGGADPATERAESSRLRARDAIRGQQLYCQWRERPVGWGSARIRRARAFRGRARSPAAPAPSGRWARRCRRRARREPPPVPRETRPSAPSERRKSWMAKSSSAIAPTAFMCARARAGDEHRSRSSALRSKQPTHAHLMALSSARQRQRRERAAA